MGFDDRRPKIDANILDLQTYNHVTTLAYASSVRRFLLKRDPARYRISYYDECTGYSFQCTGSDFLTQYDCMPQTRREAWECRQFLKRYGVLS